ncbi:MAG: hypothetical protein KKC01_04725 [Gammaproteobacteria bacterium]|nr:hypothetical protein [Gammaproteobacteria bacterium]
MILRRLATALRQQDWFTVMVEILIVVLGVFIGIQVANWNDARIERIQETAILERLAIEVEALVEIQREELADNEARARKVISIYPVLFGQEPLRALTPDECFTVTSSHVYRRPTDEIPILDELQETGRFDLIRDRTVKVRLRDYILLRERARGHYQEITNELFRLHSRHPQTLRIERVSVEHASSSGWNSFSGEGFHWQSVCDTAAMRANQQFLNEFVDNASRRETQIRFYRQRLDALLAISEALDPGAGPAPEHEVAR